MNKPSGPALKLLDTSLEVHDRKQFELKLDYQPSGADPTAQYLVEAWLFVPRSLNIDCDTWPREAFYADLHNYVRLKTPALTFDEIRTSPLSPLVQFEASAKRGAAMERSELIYDAKMLSCVMRGALRRFVKSLRKRCGALVDASLAGEKPVHELAGAAQQSIDAIGDVLRRYRAAVAAMTEANVLDERSLTSLKLVDEFTSLLVEHYVRKAVVQMNELPHSQEFDGLRRDLMAVVLRDEAYRKEHGFKSVIAPGTDNEEYTHRVGFLKKFCMNVLFLTVHRSSPRKAWEEVLFAMAAGGAMAVALGVGLFAQSRYPQASFNFFIIAVIGYMLKDRIKEGLRRTAAKTAGKFLYERATHLVDPITQEPVGVCKEKVDYGHADLVPSDVQALRCKDDLTMVAQGELEESVIRYRKTISLDADLFPRLADGIVSGLTDIIRINVDRLLRDMDDPEYAIDYVDLADFSIEELKASKAYFVDLAFRFSVDDAHHKAQELRLVRLVLDRNGIKRMVELDRARRPLQLVAS